MRNHRKSNNRQEWVRAEPHRRWAETLAASWSTCGSVASCSRASPWCNVVEVSSVSYEPVIKEAHTATFSPAHLLVILSFLEQSCFFFPLPGFCTSWTLCYQDLPHLLARLTLFHPWGSSINVASKNILCCTCPVLLTSQGILSFFSLILLFLTIS